MDIISYRSHLILENTICYSSHLIRRGHYLDIIWDLLKLQTQKGKVAGQDLSLYFVFFHSGTEVVPLFWHFDHSCYPWWFGFGPWNNLLENKELHLTWSPFEWSDNHCNLVQDELWKSRQRRSKNFWTTTSSMYTTSLTRESSSSSQSSLS